MTSYGNIFFTAVCRLDGNHATVICSHSHNTETDLNGVKQVLEQPNMTMSPAKHYSFTVGQLAWHIIAGSYFYFVSAAAIMIMKIC